VDGTDFKPRSFGVKVTGTGRPVIFIPGLGCPGAMWDDTVAQLEGVEAHVLTLSGFAGRPAFKGAPSANVRKEIVRYIRANRLKSPVVVGHSMGGFIAYWVGATAPGLLGGVIVVDAGPSLRDSDPMLGRALRNNWAQAGDDELPEMVRTAYSSMVADPKRIEPFIAQIARSDRQTIGDAIYELVTTDLRAQVAKITVPLLLVLADGGLQQRYTELAAPIPDHQIVVLPRTRHFVFLDDPDRFVREVQRFLDDHPPNR
jgi:pimeloyl-ACP methyl ester carboxylesterase